MDLFRQYYENDAKYIKCITLNFINGNDGLSHSSKECRGDKNFEKYHNKIKSLKNKISKTDHISIDVKIQSVLLGNCNKSFCIPYLYFQFIKPNKMSIGNLFRDEHYDIEYD